MSAGGPLRGEVDRGPPRLIATQVADARALAAGVLDPLDGHHDEPASACTAASPEQPDSLLLCANG